MKIQNRQQFLIMLTGAALALLVGVNWIYEPLAGMWSARSQEIKALHMKVNDGSFLKKREADIRSRWDNMRENALPANTSLAGKPGDHGVQQLVAQQRRGNHQRHAAMEKRLDELS